MAADEGGESPRTAFERSREKRRGVRQASSELEEALARPAGGDAKIWSAAASDCLLQLAVAFRNHAEQSEGPDGLLTEIIDAEPRLANCVQQLKREHQEILAGISQLEDSTRGNEDPARIAPVRDQAMQLLRDIGAHRQRGADLIYEAYSVDIEGGD